MTKTLEYSMDYSQECEDFTFEIQSDYGDREDHSDKVNHKQVTDFYQFIGSGCNRIFFYPKTEPRVQSLGLMIIRCQ